MSAEGEEVVVPANALKVQNGGEDVRYALLHGGAGRLVAAQGALSARRRQGLAVYFVIGAERQRRQKDHGCGYHVRRQLRLHVVEQGLHGRLLSSVRHHIDDQAFVRSRVLPDDGNAAMDLRLRSQDRLDFAELNTEASELDLLVQSSQELNHAVRQIASPIASPVQSSRAIEAEGVFEEPLGSQLGPVIVALGKPGAAKIDLTRNADRHKL